MAQLTLRVPDELVARLRAAASRRTTSVNAYVTAVLDAATNPNLADSDSARLRERLRVAGLLAADEGEGRERPSSSRVARARATAGKGTPLSQIISSSR